MKNILKFKKLNRWIINIMDMGFILIGFYGAFLFKFGWDPPAKNFQPFIRLLPFIILFSFIFINIYDIVETVKKDFGHGGLGIPDIDDASYHHHGADSLSFEASHSHGAYSSYPLPYNSLC